MERGPHRERVSRRDVRDVCKSEHIGSVAGSDRDGSDNPSGRHEGTLVPLEEEVQAGGLAFVIGKLCSEYGVRDDVGSFAAVGRWDEELFLELDVGAWVHSL